MFIINPYDYESLLMIYNKITRKEAKKLVDKMYLEQYGVTREEHQRQLEEELKNFKLEGFKYDPNR